MHRVIVLVIVTALFLYIIYTTRVSGDTESIIIHIIRTLKTLKSDARVYLLL